MGQMLGSSTEVAPDHALLQRSGGILFSAVSPSFGRLLRTNEAEAIQHGDEVYLRTYTGNRISVQGSEVHAQWDRRGSSETFVVERLFGGTGTVQSGDKVTLRAHTGKRLTIQNDRVHAKWDHRGSWQTLTIENFEGAGPIRAGEKVFLTAWTGKRLDADGEGSGKVTARWSDKGMWQSLVIELKSRPTMLPPTSSATTAPTTVATTTPIPQTTTQTSSPTPLQDGEPCSTVWQQCGGIGWTGPACCEAGSSCSDQSEWYSSCEPDPHSSSTPEPSSTSTSQASASAPTGSTTSTAVAATTAGATVTTAPASAATSLTLPLPSADASMTTHIADEGGEWTTGTWTTGYWDCCKPSCSWPGKGRLSAPILACDIKTGNFSDPLEASVCDGGDAAGCPDQQPFVVPDTGGRFSMGFAAGSVGGASGLSGDENCGQCYELDFVEKRHPDGNWGGSNPELVGKRMVVQISNIGHDVTGQHSFDIQIPGAGRGIFKDGCARQFKLDRDKEMGAFDCGTPYGGCNAKAGCSHLPAELRPGCEWRFDWFRWLAEGGQTNNPYVRFRRVRCPPALVAISGAAPTDDEAFPEVVFGASDGAVPV